jgi:hypothetical protein
MAWPVVETPTVAGRVGDAALRRLGTPDIPELIALARESLPDTMASRLGDRFAARYFEALLAHDQMQADGYFLDGRLVGFITYTADTIAAFRAVFLQHAVPFTVALLPALLSPVRAVYIFRIALAVLARGCEDGDGVAAELLSIGLLRDVRGASRPGGQVAHELVQRACRDLASRGVREVKVFCKPEEVEPVANGFVRKEGFVLRGRVTRFGIPANLYVKPLAVDSP